VPEPRARGARAAKPDEEARLRASLPPSEPGADLGADSFAPSADRAAANQESA